MAAFKLCKVCGKEYEYCHTLRSSNVFRWQDVACSPECGAIYFERIRKSREAKIDNAVVLTLHEASDTDIDEYDPLFEEFFEDEDE